jgi:hypothetical protein
MEEGLYLKSMLMIIKRRRMMIELLKYYLFTKWFKKRKKRTPQIINNVRLGGTDRRYRKRSDKE